MCIRDRCLYAGARCLYARPYISTVAWCFISVPRDLWVETRWARPERARRPISWPAGGYGASEYNVVGHSDAAKKARAEEGREP
eukprot:12036233-Alexandrium_andersonii.AAC.1